MVNIDVYWAGFAGKTDLEQAKVDVVCATCQDFVSALMPLFQEEEEARKVGQRYIGVLYIQL